MSLSFYGVSSLRKLLSQAGSDVLLYNQIMDATASKHTNRSLTEEQVTHFHQRGYLRIGKLLEDEHLEELRAEYDRVFAEARETERYRNLAASEDDTDGGDGQEMLQIMQMRN